MRVGRNVINRLAILAEPARSPMLAAILTGHYLALDDRNDDFRLGSSDRKRRHAHSRGPHRLNKGLPTVAAGEPSIAAEQINAVSGGAGYERLCRDGGFRGERRLPLACFETEYAALRRADRSLAVAQKCHSEYRAENEIGRFTSPAQSAITGSEQTEIGAGQQMGPVPRVDGYDQGGIKKQSNIGPEPSAAKVARTKHAAIGAGIVRAYAASGHGYYQEHQNDLINARQLLQTTTRASHAATQPVQFASACPTQGLRDFSPGAKAI